MTPSNERYVLICSFRIVSMVFFLLFSGHFQVPELESKVAELIISNDISARIDSTKSTLHAKHTEQRAVSCRKVRGWGLGLA